MSVAQTIKLPILTYHSIDESGSVISTSLETFKRQIKLLSDEGFNVISLKDLTVGPDRRDHIPPKTIILTFDDGFQNFYSTAFPILKEHNFTATVFLITDHCGKYNDWDENLASIERARLMDWEEIKELSKYGIEFGSHTQTHPDLTQIPIELATKEAVQSKLTLEEKLGIESAAFAYPYGKYNPAVRNLIEANFKMACSTRLGKADFGDDLFTLKRLDTYYLSNERIFSSILSAKFDLYMGFRQSMRDLKAAWYSK